MTLEIYLENVWIKVKETWDKKWVYWTEFDGIQSIEFDTLNEAIKAAKADVQKALEEYGNLSSPSQTGEDSSWQSYDSEF